MTSVKNTGFSKQHGLISIFSKLYVALLYALHNFASSNGLFSFSRRTSRRVRWVSRRCCTLHFSTSHTESHMPPLLLRAAAATANPRYRWIIPNAEGIETTVHRGQPSWAGRLPAHRLQFRFAILNSPEDEYAPRGARKNDNVRIRWEKKNRYRKRGKLSCKLRWKRTNQLFVRREIYMWKHTHIHTYTCTCIFSRTKVSFSRNMSWHNI